ncbi:MAG: peptidoglycan-binding protein [Patescibacteria group bacterium]
MNKTTNKNTSRKSIILGGVLVTTLAGAFFGVQIAYAAITNQLDFGSTGSDVTQLQTYLATNASMYPSGLITGYFGPLTQAAVQRFQEAQGIVSSGSPASTGYGRVGPTTMARINSLLGSGGGSVSWDTVPVLSNPIVTVTNTSATFTWTTNEPTRGQVYWDEVPLRSDEATGPFQQPYVSGALALDAGGLQTNHTVIVSNLQANRIYHYLVRGIDSVGNTTMIWPTTFRTNQ